MTVRQYPSSFTVEADAAPEARQLIAERYRKEPAHISEEWNPVLATLLSHRSVRAFTDRPVSDETLAAAVAAAQSAATSSNTQSWSVIAVRDPERKARLADLAASQRQIREAPLFLVWLADLSRVEAIGKQADIEVEGVHYLETAIVGIVDATLAAQNAVVALESLGLGTNYIGGLRNHPEHVAQELNLPPRVFAVFGLCVGYPDETRPASIKPRLGQSAVLHGETYSWERQNEAIGRYNASLRQFQAEQNLPSEDWTNIVVNRFRSADRLHGRDRIRAALAHLGFDLR